MDYKLLSVPIFLLGGVVYLICFIKTLQKYREKKSQTAILLLILFISCVVINLSSAMDGVFWQNLYEFRWGYAISMPFTALGICSLLFFATNVFSDISETKKKEKRILRIFFVVYILALSIWAVICLLPSSTIESAIPLSIIFLTSLTVYIIIAQQSYKLSKRIEEASFKTIISYIGHYATGNIFIYIFFIIDGIDPALDGTTIWSFIGVIVFVFTAILAYKGFISPMRSKKIQN